MVCLFALIALCQKLLVWLSLAILQELILRLDIALENRTLSPEEFELRARLKKKRVLALAVLERAVKSKPLA